MQIEKVEKIRVGELLHLGRLWKGKAVVAVGLLVGFFLAMATDFALSTAMEMTALQDGDGPRATEEYIGDAGEASRVPPSFFLVS